MLADKFKSENNKKLKAIAKEVALWSYSPAGLYLSIKLRRTAAITFIFFIISMMLDRYGITEFILDYFQLTKSDKLQTTLLSLVIGLLYFIISKAPNSFNAYIDKELSDYKPYNQVAFSKLQESTRLNGINKNNLVDWLFEEYESLPVDERENYPFKFIDK